VVELRLPEQGDQIILPQVLSGDLEDRLEEGLDLGGLDPGREGEGVDAVLIERQRQVSSRERAG